MQAYKDKIYILPSVFRMLMNRDYSIRVRGDSFYPRPSFPKSVGQMLFSAKTEMMYKKARYDRMQLFMRDNGRMEVILPEDPLNQAIYLTLFPENAYILADSCMIRVADSAQSFIGLLGCEGLQDLTVRLRQEYDGRRHKRHKGSIGVNFCDYTASDLKIIQGEGVTRMPVQLIIPEEGYSLAARLDSALEELGFMQELEERGPAAVKKAIDDTLGHLNFLLSL